MRTNFRTRRSAATTRSRTQNRTARTSRSTRKSQSTRSSQATTENKRDNLRQRANKPGIRGRLQQLQQNRGANRGGSGQGNVQEANDGRLFGRRNREGARRLFMRRRLGIRNNTNNNTVNNRTTNTPVNNRTTDAPVNNQAARASAQEILTGWKQGGQKNCVTVAGIKAAQAMYGAELANSTDPTRGVFKSADRTDSGGLNIVMRDGFSIKLTKNELDVAAKYSGFRLNKSNDKALLQNANEIYAAAGKRAQIEGNDGRRPNSMSYTQALRTLNNGEDTYRTSEHLGRIGLDDYTEKVTRSDLKNHPAWVSRTPGHAYMGTGSNRDYYGRSGSLGRGSNFGFVLKPIKPE